MTERTHRAPGADEINKARRRANGHAQSNARFAPIRWRDYEYSPGGEEWLVHELLPTEGVAVLYGKWKSFKTFVALDLGIAIARRDKRTWAGHVTRQGAVIYIACEGARGLRKRIEAYKRKQPELDDLDFYIVPARPALGLHPGDAKVLAQAIRDALGKETPVLIIIDTLARTLAGRDENGEGMRNFIDGAEDLGDAFGCLVLAVHHEGAGDRDRMRGNTALDAASVATWHVKRSSDGNTLGCTVCVQEAKDSESGLTLDVTFKRFEFGDEHDDERESTLIVDDIIPGGSGGPRKGGVNVGRGERATMAAFAIGLEQHGENVRLPNRGPCVRGVSVEAVRRIYVSKRADDMTDDLKRRTFDRHLEKLVDSEALLSGQIGGVRMLWKPSKH